MTELTPHTGSASAGVLLEERVISETARAIRFAFKVAGEMYSLRGWSPETVTADVRDDVFATMSRHDNIYNQGFDREWSPAHTANLIQRAEWSV